MTRKKIRLQLLQLWTPTLPRPRATKQQPQAAKRRNHSVSAKILGRTFLKLPAITEIRRAIIPETAPSQKTSSSLIDLHVDDCHQEANGNIPGTLQWVPCIRYPVQFQEDQEKVKALPDSDSEVNTMTLAYAAK